MVQVKQLPGSETMTVDATLWGIRTALQQPSDLLSSFNCFKIDFDGENNK